MRIADGLVMELDQEAATTRRVLASVPGDKLTWRPHPKSMSLGQLALHVAQVPGQVAHLAQASIDSPPAFQQPEATSTEQLLEALDAGVADAKKTVGAWDDAAMIETWSMTSGSRTLLSLPRAGLLRAIMLNHWYHHRGQLLVYLRLLDVAVPSVYGPSADENPFA